MDVPRNMTGLYLGGFIQEGYLPPRERKSTIPSTLYRGHVVKLARAPNSNPHRSSVGRYPMHSLNSGFAGLKVPIKDQMNFKNPDEQRASWRPKTRGKWANYPMTIEIRKVAGNGSSASYLAECVLAGAHTDKTTPVEGGPSRSAHLVGATRTSHTPSLYRESDEEQFYQTMFEEIRQVVSVQDDAMKRNREKLRRILINDSNAGIRPDVVSPARGQKRVATSYGHQRRPIAPSPTSKRPHTTLPPNEALRASSLLLPVPFVSHHRPQTKERSVTRAGNVTPWLPNVVVTSPRLQKAKAERNYRDDGVRWNTPEPPSAPSQNGQANIGVTSFERLQKLLDAAAQEELDSPRRERIRAGTVRDIAARKPPIDASNRLDASTEPEPTPLQLQQAALSVVVPASYQDEQSLPTTPLPCTPLPPTPEPHPADMGSAASRLTRKTSNHTPSPPPSEVSIKLTVERDDGKRVPINFEMEVDSKHKESAIETILDEVESQAERKRRELEKLLLEHQQIVHEIVRLETTAK